LVLTSCSEECSPGWGVPLQKAEEEDGDEEEEMMMMMMTMRGIQC